MSVGEIGWESLGFCSKRWRSGHDEGRVVDLSLVSVIRPLNAQANKHLARIRICYGVPEQFSTPGRTGVMRVVLGLYIHPTLAPDGDSRFARQSML